VCWTDPWLGVDRERACEAITLCKLWLWGRCTVASQLDCGVAVVTGVFEHGLGLADGITGEAIMLVSKTFLGDLNPVTSLIPAGCHLNFL
jgi:hypothetical protein